MAAHARSARGLQVHGMSTLKGPGPSPAPSQASSLSSRSTFQKPFDTAYHQLQKRRDLEFIKGLFSDCDVDRSGFIDKKEFTDCMNHPRTFRIFQERFGVQKHQTAMVFGAFDIDGDRTICLKEFLETCTFLMQVVKDGQVVTNWRQKDLRTLKETWPTQLEPLGSIKKNASEPSLARAVIAPVRGGRLRAS